jgi:hypothetical protein
MDLPLSHSRKVSTGYLEQFRGPSAVWYISVWLSTFLAFGLGQHRQSLIHQPHTRQLFLGISEPFIGTPHLSMHTGTPSLPDPLGQDRHLFNTKAAAPSDTVVPLRLLSHFKAYAASADWTRSKASPDVDPESPDTQFVNKTVQAKPNAPGQAYLSWYGLNLSTSRRIERGKLTHLDHDTDVGDRPRRCGGEAHRVPYQQGGALPPFTRSST